MSTRKGISRGTSHWFHNNLKPNIQSNETKNVIQLWRMYWQQVSDSGDNEPFFRLLQN